MAKYKVRSNLKHNGARYAAGDVIEDLDEAAAKDLLAAKAIEAFESEGTDNAPLDSSQNPNGSDGNDQQPPANDPPSDPSGTDTTTPPAAPAAGSDPATPPAAPEAPANTAPLDPATAGSSPAQPASPASSDPASDPNAPQTPAAPVTPPAPDPANTTPAAPAAPVEGQPTPDQIANDPQLQ